MPYIIVSKLVSVEKQLVGWAYRETPDDISDSGWRMFAGVESQEYIDNPDNMAICGVNTIFEIDPSIKEILEKPIGCEIEKNARAEWIEV